MNWKTVLVHLDNSRACQARMQFSFDLARRFDAHVIGLYLVCQDLAHHLFGPAEREKRSAYERDQRVALEAAHERFERAAKLAAVSAEWRAPAGSPAQAVTLHGRHADVLVLGQDDPDDPAAFVARGFVEETVLQAGRPVLLVPRSADIRGVADNIVIAWDDSREAARAVADALPLLQRARFVEIVTVERHKNEQAPAGIDISAYLDRQRVRASFVSMPRLRGDSTGLTLLDRANSVHTDMLVTGAFAHWRGLERVLGGVTRTLVEGTTMPLLFSH